MKRTIDFALDFIADTWLPLGVLLMCFAAYLIG